MPYIHIEPDLYLVHDGIEVFCIYDDGGMGRPIRYWFTTDQDNSDGFLGHGRGGQFDARMLTRHWETTPTVHQWEEFWKPRFKNEGEAIDALIREAIDRRSAALNIHNVSSGERDD